jgi:Tat protein secretion system quality control protein TatD with DNase activity
MIKKIFIAILLVAASQSFSHASEKSEIIKQIDREKVYLETGRPRDPNITRSDFNKQCIQRICKLNKQLTSIEAKKRK